MTKTIITEIARKTWKTVDPARHGSPATTVRYTRIESIVDWLDIPENGRYAGTSETDVKVYASDSDGPYLGQLIHHSRQGT